MTDAMILSKMSVTRMSHDLAGIIGAVSNSLELLAETETGDRESLSLAQSGAESLVARLAFFRMAYGADGSLTDVGVAHRILTAYLQSLENKSVTFECAFNVDSGVPLFVLRLALLGVQICADFLVRGGKITVDAVAGDKKLTVRASGVKMAEDIGIAPLLNGTETTVSSPRQSGAAMAALTARENRWQSSFVRTETDLMLSFFA